jgi:hypothetical protein
MKPQNTHFIYNFKVSKPFREKCTHEKSHSKQASTTQMTNNKNKTVGSLPNSQLNAATKCVSQTSIKLWRLKNPSKPNKHSNANRGQIFIRHS